jgi:glycosyltransferase involved in cell wall biosynthesis
MIDITFIILTKNEEINIVDCIDSIKHFASRIVIVDSGSTDKTQIIAKYVDIQIESDSLKESDKSDLHAYLPIVVVPSFQESYSIYDLSLD